MTTPRTLQEAILYFSDFDRCQDFMISIRWADGRVRCPECGSTAVTYLKNQRRWKCYEKHPRQQFSLKVGTIFEDSPLGLDKWFAAVWLVVNCKNGISSYEMARDLGITQKSAWHMNHRIRLALQEGSFDKLSGEVEVDETFIGGKARNMHIAQRKRRITGRGVTDKTAVLGVLERGGRMRTTVVENRKKETLQAEVRAQVEAGSALYSDELLSYNGLESHYAHQVIDHAVAYVKGNVHTNGMENYWALLKRGINGTYVSIEPFHLFRYLDEQAFRFNNRKAERGDCERFKLALSQVVGKRLRYDEVSGKTFDPSAH
jgi:transposase-like protein